MQIIPVQSRYVACPFMPVPVPPILHDRQFPPQVSAK
jgi:hypothetical protein